jgi:type IV secretion system protein VirB5
MGAGLTAGLIWQSVHSAITPWVVEVDKLGRAEAIAPAVASYHPSDPEIAWYLAHFIKDVRSLPADPVVLRQDWLEAYNYVTDKGALRLGDYARHTDPFSRLGTEQVSVAVSSVIRASPDSFRIAWIERHYANDALASTQHWSAILTVTLETPTTANQLKRNPLGIYIDAINWSKEFD